MNTLLIACGLVLGTSQATPSSVSAEARAPQALPRLAEVVALDREGLHRIELRGTSGAGLEVVELRRSPFPATSDTASFPRSLWKGRVLGRFDARDMSYTADASGAWTVAATVAGARARRILCWSSDEAVDAGRARPMLVTRVERLAAHDGDTSGTLKDVFDPHAFTWNGERYLAGSGYEGSLLTRRQGAEVVWLARLDPHRAEASLPAGDTTSPRQATLRGRSIGHGIDPRFVTFDGTAYIAVRTAETYSEAHGCSRLRFYRSDDLRSWTLDADLSDKLVVAGNYSVAFRQGRLTVATTDTEDDSSRIVVSAFDLRSLEWLDDAGINSQFNLVQDVRDPIWLTPDDDTGGRLGELVFTSASGNLSRR